MKRIVMSLLFGSCLFFSACDFMKQTCPPLEVPCITEGNTVPVVENPAQCCDGLELIPPKDPETVGIEGYCTANCGDGICNTEIESSYNCPQDCTCMDIDCFDDNACTTDECVDGECVFTDVICEEGYECINGECQEIDICKDVNCDTGYTCIDGECLPLDPCLDVVCTNGLVCTEGECVPIDPCLDLVCSTGFVCINGECVNLCEGIECDDEDPCTTDECVEGECVFTDVICEEGYECNTNGECVDACEFVDFECDPGFLCYLGECVPDLCVDGPDCLPGFTCNSITGKCDPDDECAALGFVCTLPEVCVEGECKDLCIDVVCQSGETCDPHTGQCQ